MIKYTAGPWAFEKHEGEEYGPMENCSFAIKGPPLDEYLPGIQLATVVSDCVDGHEANARLIASAPCLLSALQAITNSGPDAIPIKEAFEMAHRAIERASGGKV